MFRTGRGVAQQNLARLIREAQRACNNSAQSVATF